MLFSFSELSNIIFSGIFATLCLSLILLLPKQTMLKQKKSAKQRQYKSRQKDTLIFIILLFNKIKKTEEKRMSYNNIKNNFFLINVLEIQDSTRNSFLTCQILYFALAIFRLHRYDSFFRFLLLVLGDINVSTGLTTVTNNSIPLNTLPFHDCGEPTMPSECNSSGCYKAHENSKWNIFKTKGLYIVHWNINSLLPKINEIRFIAKQSNASIIGISKSKLDLSILNSGLNTKDYDLIRLYRSRRGGGVTCYIRKFLSYNHKSSFCRDIESIFIDIFLSKSKPTLVGVTT